MIAILCQTFSLTKRFDGFVRPGRYIRNIEQEQMRLLKARILGFQSFGDSGDIEFLDGINLIVGQNNAGKSAFLRALQPSLADDRHRNPDRWEEFKLPKPDVRLTIDMSGKEFRDEMLRNGQSFIPIKHDEGVEIYMAALLAEAHIPVMIIHRPGQAFTATYPGHGMFEWIPGQPQFCALASQNEGELRFSKHRQGDDLTAARVYDLWHRSMFYFSAERMNVGVCAIENVLRLSANAQNLPAVLLTLSGDRGDVFEKLVQHLREVFPTIGHVSARPLPGQSTAVEIRVWPTEVRETVELSFPLLQSGTGVAQVMSILTAVMTVESAVIIIDEINSFLHPAAVKALLRILQTDYSQHQYLISTHSPEVISFSNPRTIHLVKREGYESSITKLALSDVNEFREVAEHLGVSMADVFAADRVIWVEGPTEELCFPQLYQKATGKTVPRGTLFTSVMATGDFMTKRRDKELVYKIYQRLSQTAVPLLVSVAFSFDSEKLSDAEKEEMKRESRGAMNFLPRRHIECYLINSSAIANFINARDLSDEASVTVDAVTAKIEKLASSEAFAIEEWKGNITDGSWQAKVDAANLIAETCSQMSEHRVTFNKKDDTLALLGIVQTDAPNQLEELSNYVENLVQLVA